MPLVNIEEQRASRRRYEALNRQKIAAAQRRRRERYQKPCPSCGAPMDGSGGFVKAPMHCSSCERAAREAPHGTNSRYTSRKHACRCDLCKRAHADYMNAYYHARRAKEATA